jgi:hypothetical protein
MNPSTKNFIVLRVPGVLYSYNQINLADALESAPQEQRQIHNGGLHSRTQFCVEIQYLRFYIK